LYVRVTSADTNDFIVNYDGRGRAIQEEQWHDWYIDVNDFAAAGVDISNVSELTIGISGANDGAIFIDNVRIYEPGCLNPPAGDTDGNCVITLIEIGNIADNWLKRQVWQQ
jgi:hypothetical protein